MLVASWALQRRLVEGCRSLERLQRQSGWRTRLVGRTCGGQLDRWWPQFARMGEHREGLLRGHAGQHHGTYCVMGGS